jgi:hypothetical protein
MGWTSEDPKHEGYLIGFVEREGVTPGPGADGLLRECSYPKDDHPRRLVAISAGCDCGWRSPRWLPSEPAEWLPHMVEAAVEEEERGRRAWHRHLEQEGAGGSPEQPDAHEDQRIPATLASLGQPSLALLPDARAWARVIPLRQRAAREGEKPMTTSFNRAGSAGSRLQLRREDSGPHHYLDGKPVNAGSVLELSLAPDSITCSFGDPHPVWLRGRYEWSFEADDPPRFCVDLGDGRPAPPREGEDATTGAAALPLPTAAILRWPSED